MHLTLNPNFLKTQTLHCQTVSKKHQGVSRRLRKRRLYPKFTSARLFSMWTHRRGGEEGKDAGDSSAAVDGPARRANKG